MNLIDLPLLMFAGLLLVGAIFDISYRVIPNWISGFIILLAFITHITLRGGEGWLFAGAGLLIPLLLMFPFYLGRVLGAGDVKLMAAVGAFAGYGNILNSLCTIILFGGVLGVIHLVINRTAYFAPILLRYYPTDEEANTQYLPYGIAIATGGVAAQFFELIHLPI